MAQHKWNGSPITRAVLTSTTAALPECCRRGRAPSPRLRRASRLRQTQACYSVRYSFGYCSLVRRNLVRRLGLIGVVSHHGYKQVGDTGPAYFTKSDELFAIHVVE